MQLYDSIDNIASYTTCYRVTILFSAYGGSYGICLEYKLYLYGFKSLATGMALGSFLHSVSLKSLQLIFYFTGLPPYTDPSGIGLII